MKVIDAGVPAGRAEVPGLTVDLQPGWGDSWRVVVRRDGDVVLTCTATCDRRGVWIVNECLPRRRRAGLAPVLIEACRRLAAERGATDVVTLCPADWDGELSATGAVLLQRVVPMWMPLDRELLGARRHPLPPACRLVPLEIAPATPELLAGLSTAADRDGDRRVWQETCDGDLGPVIGGASLGVVEGDAVLAAVAVTEYHGAPLIAHLVTDSRRRGSGLGRHLLVECLIGLSEAGYADCHLNVVEDNWAAHRLYRSIGFRPDGPVLRAAHLTASGRP